ncbi:helix-turn-helix transcriptional regulator [Streptomyces sp. B1866]|uniref:helix-turn-helix domain-containing protein n=1 Tax=Streptomyces sp. B1866 TaxID=3075431 RepID=UPI002890C336|nr:helix-turn-helix transcriptional regulator [Streptomyces sp. B1866]MDT3395494.1 helix-turn-helix transcriptional regulator [Streptomyces sp. B1866]
MSRIGLGRALKRLREGKGLVITEVGARLGCDPSMISKIELGRRACSQALITGLLDLYDVPSEQRESLIELHTDTKDRRQGWWHSYSDVISAAYERYLAFEDAAAQVREYQLGIVPGLLQTEDYARAVMSVGFASLGPDQVDGLVEVRMQRQRNRLFEARVPMQCHYVVTQAALEFQVGGPRVQRAQLQHLLDVSERDHVKLQVIPYEKGDEGSQLAGFYLLSFEDPDTPDVGFGDSLAGILTMDEPRDVRRLNRLFRSLSQAALPDDETRDLIERIKNRKNDGQG